MKNKKKAQVFHFDLYGKREAKYDFLNNNSVKSINWNELDYKEPYYFFVKKDFSDEGIYIKGFKLDVIFTKYVSGFQTKRDKITIQLTNLEIEKIRNFFIESDIETIKKKFELPDDGRDWTIEWAKEDLIKNNKIQKVSYRPFDDRVTYYSDQSKGFIAYPRNELNQHFKSANLGLILKRSRLIGDSLNWKHIGIVNKKCDINFLADQSFVFPLYLYPDSTAQITTSQTAVRSPNLNMEIVNQIAEKLDLRFTAEKEQTEGTLAPIDILDYIYAVLHSPTYREKYKEFLKIDFPRIPYPKDAETFWQLVRFGGELRQIHLLESPVVEKRITTYPQAGDNIVIKPRFENGKVRINDEQYFDNVPEIAWGFYIGGYQPAQKWLKDRKGRKLNFDDIEHYQKIITALSETDKIMKKIDEIDFIIP